MGTAKKETDIRVVHPSLGLSLPLSHWLCVLFCRSSLLSTDYDSMFSIQRFSNISNTKRQPLHL